MLMVKETHLIWDLFSNHITNILLGCVSQFTGCDLQKFLEGASIFPRYSKQVRPSKPFEFLGMVCRVYWHPESGVMGDDCIAR